MKAQPLTASDDDTAPFVRLWAAVIGQAVKDAQNGDLSARLWVEEVVSRNPDQIDLGRFRGVQNW